MPREKDRWLMGARTRGKEVLNDEMGFLVSREVEVPRQSQTIRRP